MVVRRMVIDTPAMVLGAGLNGLGVARSLARAKVPVWLLDSDGRRAEMRTRAAKAIEIRALHGETLVEDLLHLAEAQFSPSRPVLILTQEETVRTVSHARDRLAPLYRFNLPPIELVDTLQHKLGFQRLAEQLNCPIPALVRIRTLDDLTLLESLSYPVVVKPGERHAEYALHFKKAYRVESASDAAELIRRILPVMADVVVQEWTEGPDSNIHFCLQYLDKHGQVTASFTGRKIRSWPPQVGGTASCKPAPETHEELSALTTRFFQAAGVTGIAGMEFKRDSRSGEFHMVEPTIGRTDYQAEVATLNGVNLPYTAYCDALDMPWPSTQALNKSFAWRVRSEDEQSASVQHQSVHEGLDNVDKVYDGFWRWNDPVPFMMHGLRRVQRALLARKVKLMPGTSVTRGKS